MLRDFRFILCTWWRFRCYKQQKITPASVWRWYKQFTPFEKAALRCLVEQVQYVSARRFPVALIDTHKRLLEWLTLHDYTLEQIIFMSFDDAGSSSAAVLNTLRDSAHLEVQGFTMLHSGEVTRISQETYKVGTGVIVYVDDFIGSGVQIRKNINAVRPLIQGNFIEVAVSVCICEEAADLLRNMAVKTFGDIIHMKTERPLHSDGHCATEEQKKVLVDLCSKIGPPHGLGFKKMATMVVLFRNSPNNTPMVLRGNRGQKPYVGLLPRTTDLAVPQELLYKAPEKNFED